MKPEMKPPVVDTEAADEKTILSPAINTASLATLLHAIAHELRTPLTSLKAFLQLIQMNLNSPEKITEYAKQTLQSCAELERSTLPLEALDQAIHESVTESVNINTIIRETMATFQEDRIELRLASGPLLVKGNHIHIRNMITILFELGLSSKGTEVSITTEEGHGHTKVVLERQADYHSPPIEGNSRFKMEDICAMGAPLHLMGILLRGAAREVRAELEWSVNENCEELITLSLASESE